MKTHEKFKVSLADSLLDVWAVARHFAGKEGYEVVVPELLIPASVKAGVSDRGDLFITDPTGSERSIEIKRYDYPAKIIGRFPHIVLDRVERLSKKAGFIDYYFVLSQNRTAAFWCEVKEVREYLVNHQERDQITGKLYSCAVLPIKHWLRMTL